jgi:hypothetical protein
MGPYTAFHDRVKIHFILHLNVIWLLCLYCIENKLVYPLISHCLLSSAVQFMFLPKSRAVEMQGTAQTHQEQLGIYLHSR